MRLHQSPCVTTTAPNPPVRVRTHSPAGCVCTVPHASAITSANSGSSLT